jgi:hypothetical protein
MDSAVSWLYELYRGKKFFCCCDKQEKSEERTMMHFLFTFFVALKKTPTLLAKKNGSRISSSLSTFNFQQTITDQRQPKQLKTALRSGRKEHKT